MCEEIKLAIEKFLEDYIKNTDLDIIECKVFQRNKDVAINILVDYCSGGISIDQCTEINKKLRDFLDNEDHIRGDYTLEVSSPGLDRPLSSEKDFNRVIGKEVRIHISEKVDGKLEHSGTVLEVSSEKVTVKTKKAIIYIDIAKINKAVQVI